MFAETCDVGGLGPTGEGSRDADRLVGRDNDRRGRHAVVDTGVGGEGRGGQAEGREGGQNVFELGHLRTPEMAFLRRRGFEWKRNAYTRTRPAAAGKGGFE